MIIVCRKKNMHTLQQYAHLEEDKSTIILFFPQSHLFHLSREPIFVILYDKTCSQCKQ